MTLVIHPITHPRRTVFLNSDFGMLGVCICKGCREKVEECPSWKPYRAFLRHLAKKRKIRRGW